MNDPRWQTDYLTEKLAESSEYVKGKRSPPDVRRALLFIALFALFIIAITIFEMALR